MPLSKRITILLPETTIRTIDRMVKPGQRSRFIDQAVQHFVASRSTEALRSQLECASVRDQDLDRQVAADWFAVDQEFGGTVQHSRTGKANLRRRGEIYVPAVEPDASLVDPEDKPSLNHSE